MALTLFLKFCLGLVGVTTVSSVIGVPVLLGTRSKTETISNRKNGGGRSDKIFVNRCENLSREGKSSVDFGAGEEGNVCWTVDSDTQLVDRDSEYSFLFQGEWSVKDKSWAQGVEDTPWMKQCIGEEKPVQWAIMVEEGSSGSQYLGLCSSSTVENTKFIKKEQRSVENADAWTLSICDSECWNSTDSGLLGNSPKILQEEKGENWREVKFYR